MREIAVGLLVTVVAGCATTPKTPPPQSLNLGKWSAQWRDYSSVDVCHEDTKRLSSELDGMNQLLAEFLASTAAGFDGVWADEHLAILDEGQKKLAPALAAYDALLNKLSACEHPEDWVLGDLVRSGSELARQAGKRVVVAESLAGYAKARQAVETWREAQGTRQASAKASVCKSRNAEIYYAAEEDGRTQWLFCDGLRAVRSGMGIEVLPQNPKHKAPPPKKTQPHLDAVSAYPPDLILRAPKMPQRPSEKLAQPEDRFDLNAPLDEQG